MSLRKSPDSSLNMGYKNDHRIRPPLRNSAHQKLQCLFCCCDLMIKDMNGARPFIGIIPQQTPPFDRSIRGFVDCVMGAGPFKGEMAQLTRDN